MIVFHDIILIMISGDTTTTTTYEGVHDIISYHHIIID